MKYFGFLLRFVLVPLLALTALGLFDRKRGKKLPRAFTGVHPAAALLGHVAVAVTYTTPWDNYLVATKVWWYDKKLVKGIILGYVPLEEYVFFVLQTLLTGQWMLTLARTMKPNEQRPAHPLAVRAGMTAALGAIWLGAVYTLVRGPKKGTYMAITLAWALPPIMLQTAFGGDILWQHRRLVALGIIPTTLYLGISDSLAIDSGTWKINPEKTVGVDLGGKLPLEEGLFFLITNTLISMGMTLVLARESRTRVPAVLAKMLPKLKE
jgi:lycopene cyclase domain-containing protein